MWAVMPPLSECVAMSRELGISEPHDICRTWLFQKSNFEANCQLGQNFASLLFKLLFASRIEMIYNWFIFMFLQII